ncbi:MAG: TonB-dependent receptor [Sediminibacterium sp.]|uniref:TonB-dependent receptor n=1 Tax=Sediminibacterium sp. TaxID=1917865 RepID=UPI002734146B|nr:TonB-dependent receptor [Sediminibacterium sp.]MDP3393781.1 TonB-dependent receptor [Sediminibacterium sp.]MDP3568889.1 TonB-dependent receptor [Sediminibacterium sp.]
MKFFATFLTILLLSIKVQSQEVPTTSNHTIKIVVREAEEKKPLAGATVMIPSLKKTLVADSNGAALFTQIPAGKYTFKISFVGYENQEIVINLPQKNDYFEILLSHEEEHEEEEVIVTSTRMSRSIADIATRVETISGEELTEKGNMKPGDIRMLLNESTGIQTQQTSATSYNSSIRIQGLDGRYTQILRDGFPLYAGFSGGLSLMQVAPLDLKQIEVIKGSSSTLYGGGAIAGLVNLVSKTPTKEKELSFLANATTAGGLDLSGFYSEQFSKVGITFFGSRNTSNAYDPAGIGLTAIPKFERYTIHPRLFFSGNKTKANFGLNYITEKRLGGSMDYIKNGSLGYFENNQTNRLTSQFQLTHQINEQSNFVFKNSYSRFNRSIQIPAYEFKGLQQTSFSEATYQYKATKHDWIIGTNFITDHFKELNTTVANSRDYQFNTWGIFIQNTWKASEILSIETGLRGDYVKQFGFELLPRIAAILKANAQLTLRLGGGMGYKTPTVFNEEAEKLHFRNIRPIDQLISINERSVGGNFDINFRTRLGEIGFAVNQLFFYTRLNSPLVLVNSGTSSSFVNANGFISTKGMETNLRLSYEDFKLFIGYTYADVNTQFNNVKNWFPLTSRHRVNNVLMYEKEGKFKIGAEAYYFSPQQLSDGAMGKSYWIFGLMAEKIWNNFSLFINFENFTDTRQTKFDTIYSGSINNPMFRDIYAPVDGFVINGGLKLRL